jgi:hypothetical protein
MIKLIKEDWDESNYFGIFYSVKLEKSKVEQSCADIFGRGVKENNVSYDYNRTEINAGRTGNIITLYSVFVNDDDETIELYTELSFDPDTLEWSVYSYEQGMAIKTKEVKGTLDDLYDLVSDSFEAYKKELNR